MPRACRTAGARQGLVLEALGRALYNSRQHERAREAFERARGGPLVALCHYALGLALSIWAATRGMDLPALAVALAPALPLPRAWTE